MEKDENTNESVRQSSIRDPRFKTYSLGHPKFKRWISGTPVKRNLLQELIIMLNPPNIDVDSYQ